MQKKKKEKLFLLFITVFFQDYEGNISEDIMCDVLVFIPGVKM